MKVVILAGGFGTRISEESKARPKPMIEIGGQPMLWHLMQFYAAFGHREFIICAGYKQEAIREWVDRGGAAPFEVTVVDTGLDTMTGGRLKRIAPLLSDEPFFLTYGDGVADVNIDELYRHHQSGNKLLTITAAHPEARFGELVLENDELLNFDEKPPQSTGYINGGFMAVKKEFISKYLTGMPDDFFERRPMQSAVNNREVQVFRHDGFWQCMDNPREYTLLNNLWESGSAPWTKFWK